jgi:hypothetical protein
VGSKEITLRPGVGNVLGSRDDRSFDIHEAGGKIGYLTGYLGGPWSDADQDTEFRVTYIEISEPGRNLSPGEWKAVVHGLRQHLPDVAELIGGNRGGEGGELHPASEKLMWLPPGAAEPEKNVVSREKMDAFLDGIFDESFDWAPEPGKPMRPGPEETDLERVERQIGHIKFMPDSYDFGIEDLGPWDTRVSEEWNRLPEADKLTRLVGQVDWSNINCATRSRLLAREVDFAQVPEEQRAAAAVENRLSEREGSACASDVELDMDR